VGPSAAARRMVRSAPTDMIWRDRRASLGLGSQGKRIR
jgi:hypothetical protein